MINKRVLFLMAVVAFLAVVSPFVAVSHKYVLFKEFIVLPETKTVIEREYELNKEPHTLRLKLPSDIRIMSVSVNGAGLSPTATIVKKNGETREFEIAGPMVNSGRNRFAFTFSSGSAQRITLLLSNYRTAVKGKVYFVSSASIAGKAGKSPFFPFLFIFALSALILFTSIALQRFIMVGTPELIRYQAISLLPISLIALSVLIFNLLSSAYTIFFVPAFYCKFLILTFLLVWSVLAFRMVFAALKTQSRLFRDRALEQQFRRFAGFIAARRFANKIVLLFIPFMAASAIFLALDFPPLAELAADFGYLSLFFAVSLFLFKRDPNG